MNGASVAQLLKLNTRIAHTQTEKEMMLVFNQLRSRSDYARLLKIYYGFYFPLEQKTSRLINHQLLNDISERTKTHLILKDLSSLGELPEQIALCDQLPRLETVEAALGCLYVMEGSTLGGRVIAKMLLNNETLELNPSCLRFFQGYGDNTGKKWVDFLQVLNGFDLQTGVITETALQTFIFFKTWIRQHAKHPFKN